MQIAYGMQRSQAASDEGQMFMYRKSVVTVAAGYVMLPGSGITI